MRYTACNGKSAGVAADPCGLILSTDLCPLHDGIDVTRQDEEIQGPAAAPRIPDFTWTVLARDVRSAASGRTRIKSADFELEGAPCKFVIRLWPNRSTARGENVCQLFLYVLGEAEVAMQVQIKVNATSRIMDAASPVIVHRKGRGWENFCAPLEGDVTVQLFVLQIGTEQKIEWALPLRYEYMKVLGCGGFGSVHQAWDKKQERKVAVKQMLGVFGSTKQATNMLREIGILSALQHSHVVKIFGAFLDKRPGLECLYIVMEMCDMDLYDVVTKARGVSLPEARRLAFNIVVGCKYLHSKRIYHRDLKPGNILVNRDCSVKICDFNLARVVDHEPNPSPCVVENVTDLPIPEPPKLQRELTNRVCTPMYRAPEVLLCLRYSEAIDNWAVGCIFFELFNALNTNGRQPTHRLLFEGRMSWPLSGRNHSPGDLLEQIVNMLGTPFQDPLFKELPVLAQDRLRRFEERKYEGFRDKVPDEMGASGLSLVQELLCFFPEHRLSMEQAYMHDFFRPARRRPHDENADTPCCLEVTYDESNLGSLEDVQGQIEHEIAKFHHE